MESGDGRSLAVLILAGGRGERFWPRSRASLPKQFLRLSGPRTLLQETFRRARRLVPADRIHVVTPARYRELTLGQLPELPAGNVILEPFGRDTAPCIGLGAVHIARRDPGATLIVLPADHLIAHEDRFHAALGAAAAVAAPGRHLVTLGVPPTRPETGYGYIQIGALLGEVNGRPVRAVRRFTEKPALEQAMGFLAAGDHLWNSGMFAWRVSLFRRLLAQHLPGLAAGLERIAAALEGASAAAGPASAAYEAAVRREFAAFERISIDCGLLERAGEVVVIPGDFGWDDVGSWAALERVRPKDERGNVIEGPVVAVDSRDCILCAGDGEAGPAAAAAGPGRLLVTYGVDNLLVVDTPDAVLVADKSRSATLKRVVEELKRLGFERHLEGEAPGARAPGGPWPADVPAGGRVVDKPWGREIWWAETDRYLGKVIEVRAGHSLSLQYHEVKLETMLFTRGRGSLLLGERALPVAPGLCVTIPPGTVHRVSAETDLAFFEVSTPDPADVVRLADDYGR